MFEWGEIQYVHPVSGAVRPVTIELLRATYLVPRQQRHFDIKYALAGVVDTPWRNSFEVAPAETAAAVDRALRELMLATSTLRMPQMDLAVLPAGSRAKRHLVSLMALWEVIGDELPDDLWVMRHVLEASANDAIESLPLLSSDFGTFRVAERALLVRLLEHHGAAPDHLRAEHAEAVATRRKRADAGTLLGEIQRRLLDDKEGRCALDGTVIAYGVRDAAMEADVTAGMIQQMLEQSPLLSPAEIGLLLPPDTAYSIYVGEAFGRAGLPLSGLPAPLDQKDLAAETVQHFLLARRTPAPAMVLASLLASPLMPWAENVGQEMANAVMSGDYRPHAAKSLEGKSASLYRIIRKDAEPTTRALAEDLAVLGRSMTSRPDLQLYVRRAQDLVGQLRAVLLEPPETAELPWDRLLRVTAMAPPTASAAVSRTMSGVTVFLDTANPWREVSHLIVLGFAEGAYPASVTANPFFLDRELELIGNICGLSMPTRARQLSERMDLFRRQIGIASHSLTLLCPYRDGMGVRLAPAASLPLFTRCIHGVEEPENFILDLDSVAEEAWPNAVPRAFETRSMLRLPPIEVPSHLLLGRDLMTLRTKEDGTIRRQSPSRLETLIVSPLSWLLHELEATEAVWSPEAVDVLRKGLLAHEVFERLFLPGEALPAKREIEDRVPKLLMERIRQTAPFMQASAWALERQSLVREITMSALVWREALETHGATVINNEFWLRGSIFGVEVHGKADCLLRLEDGQLIIVDHKKSGTRNRQGRLQAGWDLQVELYRTMAKAPSSEENVDEAREFLASANRVGVAYHLMNDSGMLVHGADLPANGHFTSIDSDISHAAMGKLGDEVVRLRSGEVRLNKEGDRKFFSNEAKMGLYAFDASPLIDAFTYAPAEENEETPDE
ncbi:PD-(D/E)XK nuclease family protein [Aminobacter sp. P9b]|uniref:PD-(D/E)XK nuclease family protein n=1 Tax=Aminobacter sp. P9b TaxID=3133697 RepID=UPI003253A732